MQNGQQMQPTDLLAYVKSELRAVGPRAWPQIAAAIGKPESLLRKIAYGNRKNPRLDSIQPIANHFQRRGRRQ